MSNAQYYMLLFNTLQLKQTTSTVLLTNRVNCSGIFQSLYVQQSAVRSKLVNQHTSICFIQMSKCD